MNRRSLGFRLVVWFASVLTAVYLFVAAAMFLELGRYLKTNFGDALRRRADEVGEILATAGAPIDEAAISNEIRSRLLPESNNRFVRVSRSDGTVVYRSGPPVDRSFDPDAVAATDAAKSAQSKSVRQFLTPGGTSMLVVARSVTATSGSYDIEVGASLEQIQLVLNYVLILLIVAVPVLVGVSTSGGYFLIKRALKSVDHIAKTAEQISHHNLSERLPVAKTGDELERLSISVNRMIGRLDEAFQTTRRFLADASHELRTPLTVIKGELEEVAGSKNLSEELRERTGSVLEEVERLTHIVEGLLAVARLDAGEAQREWLRFDLAELVATTADQMKLLAEDQRITLVCNTGSRVDVEGDHVRLKQVIVNLLDNAIKYTPEGGSIHLSVRAQDRAVLEIVDTGIGIPKDELAHVFERFFRVDKARSRNVEGTGLGLAIVKSICTAHGAEIETESTIGRGSCFRIKFPLAATVDSR
ncbi:MAG TPA: ATP-binding protein [Gammaproteobacteria bacterium]|nr:ATP-binding protein [Gammaproteobacteria bacterium]